MKKFLLPAIFVLLFGCTSHARGNKEKEPTPAIIQVTGRVSMVNQSYSSDVVIYYDENGQHHTTASGTLMFYEIIIENDEGTWYIAYDERYKLLNYQRQTVTAEGEERVIDMTLGNGPPTVTRRLLNDVRIIRIH